MNTPPGPETITLDTNFVRGQFPDLGKLAFFENAGGTLAANTVIRRLNAYLNETQVQPGGDYGPSALAVQRMAQSHRQVAAMINATPEEVMVGISTSMNVYLLSHALRHWFKPGDEIVVTDMDHEANNGAWRRLAEFGVVIRQWQVNPDTVELEAAELTPLLNERTRLVCFTHCSNITGTIHDVASLVRTIHAAGALACVDAVAYAPHRLLDVQATDVDFYLFSPYKLYGPHLGVLYGKRELLLRAATQHHFFIPDEDTALKLNPGGPNHELTAALGGVGEYFDALHAHHFPGSNEDFHTRLGQCFELITQHEQHIAEPFVEYLRSVPGLRLLGRASADKAQRVPTFSFVVEGRDSHEFPAHCARHDVGIRSGDFYARRLIDALGYGPQNGVVRASMVHYNTADEVARLIHHLDEVL